MRRREFITILGGTLAQPLAGTDAPRRRVAPFSRERSSDPGNCGGLCPGAGASWLECWREHSDRLPLCRGATRLFKTYAAELVGLSPDTVLASTPPAVEALRQQTPAMPIVFVLVQDPVGLGLVQSLARPGGDITGFGAVDPPIMGKWLQLLKEVAPSVTRVAAIFNPETQPYATFFNSAIEGTAPSFGMTVTLAPVHDDSGIEETIAAQARKPGGSLICVPDPFNATHRNVIIAAATRHGLPLIGAGDLFPRAGALMTYWYDPVEAHAQAASYIDRILRGTKPADLPVQYPTKYSLVVNLKTAKALSLTVPPSMLDLADDVVE